MQVIRGGGVDVWTIGSNLACCDSDLIGQKGGMSGQLRPAALLLPEMGSGSVGRVDALS